MPSFIWPSTRCWWASTSKIALPGSARGSKSWPHMGSQHMAELISEFQDAFIFEDDYDSEYRYNGRPVEALQGLDRNGRVIYAGTFSKLLFPAVRLGYL